ncbi:MAG: saccharopine dehydrogenase NADP-binding domain-containing protein [Theionarchaea archaeon]|nr:saccharopine dehydrogenase NADP-binding domain-containing protein [Theionarchaea archaeon]MBU7020795.1 saccharopine dehydrogenase NADP-binding domain-containing protein [Theionarchaea archaeon]MBU7034809.1 saccharopine dehydrogenase NADP-binding domain-containing protein [Theionarchaea archaeon]MBU7040278.1 saccharopine dehydrogenase NADP-binding domain-containing protein [Theionarchaea archaeon]
MKVLLLGAGMMGRALAHDLTGNGVETFIADANPQLVEAIRELTGAEGAVLDVTDRDSVVRQMADCDVAVSAVPYFLNLDLASAAIEAGCHFCDLGGNTDIVTQELALHESAERADVLIVPDCGLAPGMSNVLTALSIEELNASEVAIRVGGLPQNPQPPFNYTLVFSVHGLLNEYIEKAVVIRKGVIQKRESLTEVEDIEFSSFGTLEAFLTSGGTSTLVNTFGGRLEELDCKTIRYQGYCEKMKTLLDAGLGSEEPVSVGKCMVKPRDVLGRVLERVLPHQDEDVVLMRITARAETREMILEMVDYYNQEDEMTAMARTTAYPTSVIAQMMGNGTITARGALPPEKTVPGRPFIEELKKRDIIIREIKNPL